MASIFAQKDHQALAHLLEGEEMKRVFQTENQLAPRLEIRKYSEREKCKEDECSWRLGAGQREASALTSFVFFKVLSSSHLLK